MNDFEVERSLSQKQNDGVDENSQEDSAKGPTQDGSMDWHTKEAWIDEGWHIVKGKKRRKKQLVSFDMTLCSHTKGLKFRET